MQFSSKQTKTDTKWKFKAARREIMLCRNPTLYMATANSRLRLRGICGISRACDEMSVTKIIDGSPHAIISNNHDCSKSTRSGGEILMETQKYHCRETGSNFTFHPVLRSADNNLICRERGDVRRLSPSATSMPSYKGPCL